LHNIISSPCVRQTWCKLLLARSHLATGDGLGTAAGDGLGVAAGDGLGVAVGEGLGVAAGELGTAAGEGLGTAAGDGEGVSGRACMCQAAAKSQSKSKPQIAHMHYSHTELQKIANDKHHDIHQEQVQLLTARMLIVEALILRPGGVGLYAGAACTHFLAACTRSCQHARISGSMHAFLLAACTRSWQHARVPGSMHAFLAASASHHAASFP
jgi:hypothetical protein